MKAGVSKWNVFNRSKLKYPLIASISDEQSRLKSKVPSGASLDGNSGGAFRAWSKTCWMTALQELHRSPLGADGLTQSKKPLSRLSCWMIPERVTPWTGVCCRDGLRSSLQRTPPEGAAKAMTLLSVSITLGCVQCGQNETH